MKKNVLIVDDSPLIHNLLKKTLEKYSYNVCGTATNGRDGVEQYKKLSPDIVFMDINMPIMDGLEAATQIKKINTAANIIMLSAIGDEASSKVISELGIKISLQKPFDDYKIISAISSI
jgi:two-component system chemotaxis response regulator CheY